MTGSIIFDPGETHKCKTPPPHLHNQGVIWLCECGQHKANTRDIRGDMYWEDIEDDDPRIPKETSAVPS